MISSDLTRDTKKISLILMFCTLSPEPRRAVPKTTGRTTGFQWILFYRSKCPTGSPFQRLDPFRPTVEHGVDILSDESRNIERTLHRPVCPVWMGLASPQSYVASSTDSIGQPTDPDSTIVAKIERCRFRLLQGTRLRLSNDVLRYLVLFLPRQRAWSEANRDSTA